jgi:hypothetical protein
LLTPSKSPFDALPWEPRASVRRSLIFFGFGIKDEK